MDALFKSNPFDWSCSNRQLFIDSFRQNALWHYERHRLFRGFWDAAHIHPNDIQCDDDLVRVPPILVTVFKEHPMCSIDERDLVLTLTSSGTGGQKSQMFLDSQSLLQVKSLAYEIHRVLGMTSPQSYNYLCFTYDPHVANDLGTAFTDELLTSFTERTEVYYAIQWTGSEFKLNTDGVLDILKRFEKSGKPTRILGFPAFLYKIIRDHDLHLHLGDDSWVQTGGGWKGHANEEIPKDHFRDYVSGRLGLPKANVRDMFGMVEHGIPYVDCERGHLHIPNYARVFLRDPETLAPLPNHAKGLLHFLCSYNTATACSSILTTDWGRLGECHCSIGGPILQIEGRAGVSKHKGCAIHALEVIK